MLDRAFAYRGALSRVISDPHCGISLTGIAIGTGKIPTPECSGAGLIVGVIVVYVNYRTVSRDEVGYCSLQDPGQ